MPRRASVVLALACALLAALAPLAHAGWRRKIERAVGHRSVGVAVRLDGRVLYRHDDRDKRVPASNEKLLLSMALLEELPADYRFRTIAAGNFAGGVVNGNLWLIGRGDPTVTAGGRYTKSLPYEPTRLGALARAIKRAGIERIKGSVAGSTGYFARDWYAQGWKSDFAAEEVPLPTALTLDYNRVGDQHVRDPERRAAESLSRKLRTLGVHVRDRATTGKAPVGLPRIAAVESDALGTLMKYMNRTSMNFFAEMFGKRLGLERHGRPGTIAKGAAAIREWAGRNGVTISSYDSSGLSYSNRVSPRGVAKLIDVVDDEPWANELRFSLAGAGQGTLEDRLRGVRLRAKTGTLTDVSTLSGWVWLNQIDDWGYFSIMSRGMDKSRAAAIEDRIVRVLHEYARPASVPLRSDDEGSAIALDEQELVVASPNQI
ncbi:MAG: D-alanyl-D-alanine carboxypeptidase/D-alanyl-D-alanine-endopeptidase [Actinomycetota bacterium]